MEPGETTSRKTTYIQKVSVRNGQRAGPRNETYRASKKAFCKSNKRRPNSKATKAKFGSNERKPFCLAQANFGTLNPIR